MAYGRALSLAQAWMNVCETQHDQCNAIAKRTMPSRVIEISWMSGAQEPSLRILQNPSFAHYAALSYCWGKDQRLTTTKATIEKFSEVVSFSDLPKSLRDGVLTTCRLSLRLLWVDSLCIVQDDSIDTAREIASMPQIYQNAHITISAARSTDSEDGFLQDLSMPSAQAKVFKFPFGCPTGDLGSVILIDEPDLWDPIERRAWPLQEFLLSRRILRYGSYQLSWSCLSAEFYENDDAGVNWYSKRDKRFPNLRRRLLDSQRQQGPHINIWGDLVEEYTRRHLKEPQDKLLAISGIATVIGTGRHDVYMGGLWLSDLPLGLLWKVSTSPPRRKPCEYRAPSWSWASVDGVVKSFATLDVDPSLRLLSYEVMPAQQTAQYGAVKAGHIEVLGLMREFCWLADRATLVDVETGVAIARDGENMALTQRDFDEGMSAADMLVWCLQISPYETKYELGPYGLILSTENGKVFQRVGMFSFDAAGFHGQHEPSFYDFHRKCQEEWAQACQLRRITII